MSPWVRVRHRESGKEQVVDAVDPAIHEVLEPRTPLPHDPSPAAGEPEAEESTGWGWRPREPDPPSEEEEPEGAA